VRPFAYAGLCLCVPLASACAADVETTCISGPCGVAAQPSYEPDAGACHGDEYPATGDLPPEIGAILVDKCHLCHGDPPPEENPGPFFLLTYENTQFLYPPGADSAKKVYIRMTKAVETDYMPFGTAPDLTEEQKATLLDWLHKCAPPVPEGTGADIGE
jgi:uncharacterized membrane protein